MLKRPGLVKERWDWITDLFEETRIRALGRMSSSHIQLSVSLVCNNDLNQNGFSKFYPKSILTRHEHNQNETYNLFHITPPVAGRDEHSKLRRFEDQIHKIIEVNLCISSLDRHISVARFVAHSQAGNSAASL